MIKLLLLCLLVTLVTVKGNEEPTTKSTEDSNSTHKTSKKDNPESSPETPPETSKVAEAHTDHPSPDHTAPLTVLQTCSCNGAVDCHENHCTVKDSKRFCVSMAETNNFDGSQDFTSRSCGDDIRLCNVNITITLNENVYWRSHTECCSDADNCNSNSTISVPPQDTAPGKVECPSCFGANETSCKPRHVKCAASETKCIYVAGSVTKGSTTKTFVGKGCANPLAARIGNGTVLRFGDTTYTFTKTILTGGTSQTPRNAPFIFILSSFVVLLQAKFIY